MSIFGASLNASGFAGLYFDANPGIAFSLQLRLGSSTSVSVSPFSGFTIGGAFQIAINTTNATRFDPLNAGVSISAQTFKIAVTNLNVNLFGFVLTGSLFIDISPNGLSITIPTSDPITLDFFGFITLSVSGNLNTNGNFSFTASATVTILNPDIFGFRGSISVTFSNGGFGGSLSGEFGAFGIKVSAFGNFFISSGFVKVAVGISLQITPEISFKFWRPFKTIRITIPAVVISGTFRMTFGALTTAPVQPPTPTLATLFGNTLRLNIGADALPDRGATFGPQDESYIITVVGPGSIEGQLLKVSALGFDQEYDNVTHILANDTLGTNNFISTDTAVLATVSINAGKTVGGQNRYILAGSGTAFVQGGSNQDAVEFSGANSTYVGGPGQSQIEDKSGGSLTVTAPGFASYLLADESLSYDNGGATSIMNFVGNSVKKVVLNGASNATYETSSIPDPSDGIATPWTGTATFNGAGASSVIQASAAGGITLTNNSVTLAGTTITLNNITVANLIGGDGPNTFNISGWTRSGSITGNGGNDTVIATNNANFTLTDVLLTRSSGGSLVLSSVNTATLTGGSSGNNFTVSSWTGSATLDGLGGTDSYTVNLSGSGNGTVTVSDTGSSGSDAVVVNGTSASDALNVSSTQVTRVSETVNYAGVETLTVNGLEAGDTLTISSTSIGSTFNGDGGNDTFNVKAISAPATVNAGLGNDTVNVGSLAPGSGGTVNAIGAHLTVNGDPGNDTLNVDDTGDSTVTNGVLTSNTLNGLGLSNAGLTYQTLALLNVSLGSGGDTFRIDTTHTFTTVINAGPGSDRVDVRTIAGATTVNGEAGIDTINVGSLAPGVGGLVDDIDAILTLNGGDDFDQINVDDTGDGTNNTGRLTSTRITDLGMGGHIDYFTTEVLDIDLGTGGDTFTIASTHPGTTRLDTRAGGDTVNVETIAGATFVDTGSGGDTINVGDTSNTTDQIGAVLTIDGESGTDELNVDDTGDGSGNTGTLTLDRITDLDMGGRIDYFGFEDLNIDLGSGSDTFTIVSTHPGTTQFDGGPGIDTVNVQTISGVTTVSGAGGNDTINVGTSAPVTGGTVNEIDAHLIVNGDGGSDTLNVDDTGDGAVNDGVLTSTTLNGLDLSGAGVTYGSLEFFNVNLGSGNDTFQIVTTHLTTTVVSAGPGGDRIDIQTIAGPTTVNGEAGIDTINVGSLAPGVGGLVDDIDAILTLNGGDDFDQINVDDTGDGTNNTGRLTSTRITDLGMGGHIDYFTTEVLDIDLGTGGDTFTIASTHPGTTRLDTRAGGDTVNVETIAGATFVDTGSGGDTINVGDTSNTTDQIGAVLTIDGESGTDELNVDDTGDATDNTGTLTSTQITGLDMAGLVDYFGVEDLNIDLGTATDTFTIITTHIGTTQFDSGPGIDTVNVQTISGVTTVSGAGDDDTINVGTLAPVTGGTVNEIDAHLIVNGDGGSDTLNVDDTGDPVANDGVLTSTTLNGLDLSSAGVTYGTLELLNVNLGSGNDTFQIVTTHLTTTVVSAGPGGDRIDIQTIAGPTTVNGEAGIDTINVGSLAPGVGGLVDDIDAILTLNGGDDFDQINVDDTGDATDNVGTLTTTRLTGLGMGGHIDYFTAEDLNIDLGTGNDTFTIVSTHGGTTTLDTNSGDDEVNVQTIAGPTFLFTRSGDDTINVGDTADTTNQIGALLTIDGGAPSAGSDILNVFDSGDAADNLGFLTDTTITGLGMALGIVYSDIEDLNIFLGSGNDIFNVLNTAAATRVYAGAGNDAVSIHRIEHETLIFGQTGDDRTHVGVTIDAVSGSLVHEDNALTLIDPRTVGTAVGQVSPNKVSRNANNLIGARLTLDGRDGSDRYFVWLGGDASVLINVFDSGGVGGDFLTVFGTEGDDLLLLRAGIGEKDLTTLVDRPVPVPVTAARAGLVPGDLAAFGSGRIGFVGLLNEGRLSTSGDVERVNYSRNVTANTGINGSLIVQGVGGFDEFYVDDNLAPTQLFGGSVRNYFQIGQLYNSARADNPSANIFDVADEFETVETTRGFLSNGISFDLTAVGALDGPNEFVVLNNQATLNLLGGDQDDTFVVRTFAQVGSVDPERRGIDISTGGGTNSVEYVVGAPINIDGGGGFNTVKIIGTEFGDDYVITEDGVFGAGRLVNFINIQQLEVDAAEGNDRFFILGTAPGTSVILSGSLGSDIFFVGGEAADIVARDLLGHSGILSHSDDSDDATFDGLGVDEISANVADNDEAGIVVTESGGETVIVNGVWRDFYTVVLTRAPNGPVTVTASVPRAVVRVDDDAELRPMAQLGSSQGGSFGDTVELVFGPADWNVPQAVWIQAADGLGHSGIVGGFVIHDVAGDRVVGTTTAALRFAGQPPNVLVDAAANFGPADSLRGATVKITEGPGKGQTRTVVANTGTTLTLHKAWTLDEVSAGAAGLAANQSIYEIRLYEGLAIPVVPVKAYFAGAGAAIATPGGGLEIIEQPGAVDFAAGSSFVGSYDVVLTEAPAPGSSVTVTVTLGGGLVTDVASLTFNSGNWDQFQTVRVAIAADGLVQKARLFEIGHSIGANALETVFVRVVDGDSATVVVTQGNGSTNVIEGGLLAAGVPSVDTYTVVLSRQPTENVEVVVRAEGTRTSKGGVVNFGDQVLVAQNPSSDGDFADTITLIFTPANWNQAQTVTVKALNDAVVDGGDTKVFARLADDTSRIQGPLLIQGGGGQGSLVGLPVAVLLPGETNDFLSSGEVILPEAQNSTSVVVSEADLNAFIVRYGLDFGLPPGSDRLETLVGKTFRLLDGPNASEFESRFGPFGAETFDPADPGHQASVPFREITGVDDLGGGSVRLSFDVAWTSAITANDDYALVNSSPENFFTVEDEQVDVLLVLDRDARSDEDGRLIFHTANDPDIDVPLANRGQLVGLSMHDGRTIGTGPGTTRLPAGIVFDEIETLDLTLGSGNDSFVIEGTHSGSTRVNTGAGNDSVEVWSVAGPTTVDAGAGNDNITVGEPDAGQRTLLRIAALLTVAGDVPSADVRTTVRGEPDVLAAGGGLVAQGSTNEQEIIINAGGGTFTLRFNGPVIDPDAQAPVGDETAPIAHDADAATIKQALVALPGLDGTDFEVERFGDRIVIRFSGTGDFAKTPMYLLGTGSENLLQTGANTLNVDGTADALDVWALLTGSTLTGMGTPVPNAIQTVYVDDPQPGDALRQFTLSFNGFTTGPLSVDSSAAQLQAALEALPSVGEGNVAVNKVDNVFVVRFQGDLTNQELSTLTSADGHVFIAVRETGIDKLDPDLFPPSADSLARNDLQTLTIGATGGTFALELSGQVTGPLAYNATADEVRDALQLLLGDRFADDISVSRFGGTYQILFQGQLRQVMGGNGVGFLKVDQNALTGTATLATRMDGINYYLIDELNIDFGSGDDVLNVQDTTAEVTNIALNDGDDRIFVSSDADLDANTLAPAGAAYDFDFLSGHLDGILGDLNIDVGAGRHIMMISDEATDLTKGTAAAPVTVQRVDGAFTQPAILGDIEIEILSLNLVGRAIRYGAAPDGNFFDGITVWGGQNGNVFDVSATHLRQSLLWRTQTTLNTGDGADKVTVNLIDGVDDFFVVNGEDGGDSIDAGGSTLPLVIFGGEGSDTIFGGEGGDLIFGDRGRIVYRDEIGGTSTVLGHGGSYDFTDGRKLPPYVIFTVDPFVGGVDEITTGNGSDVIVGGRLGDTINAGEGNNTLVGDAAWIEIDFGLSEVNLASQHASAVPLRVESVLDTFDLQRAWDFDIDPFTSPDLVIAGGGDTIDTGSGDDIVAGGLGNDGITIVAGDNTVLGDNGIVTFQPGTRTLGSVVSTYLRTAAQTFVQGGNDTIETGPGNDVVIGGLGNDGITIAGGNNIALGDDGTATFQPGSGLPNRIESRYLDGSGLSALNAVGVVVGDDTISTGSGNDVIIGGLGDITVSGVVTIAAGGGNNIIFGDEGFIQYQLQGPTATDPVLGEVSSQYLDDPDIGPDNFVQGGNETITTGAGNDIVIAGLGNDGITITGGNNIVFGDEGRITYQTTSGLRNRIESLYLDGSGLSALDADSAAVVGNDTVSTGAGNDVVIGGLGDITVLGVATIAAGGGNNIIFGDEGFIQYQLQGPTATVPVLGEVSSQYLDDPDIGPDNFVQSGNETITTGAGNDIVIAGLGNDGITITGGHNIVLADEGGIRYQTGTGFLGWIESRYLDGADQSPHDASEAMVGDDIITTGIGNDIAIGGLGDDVISVSEGNNIVLGDEGEIHYQDPLAELGEIVTLFTDGDGDFVQGGDDTITTGDGSDFILSGSGSDLVNAGDGDDVILGDGQILFHAGTSIPASIISSFLDGNGVLLPPSDAVIFAGGGDDIVVAGSGNDWVEGGTGDDLLIGDEVVITFDVGAAVVDFVETVFFTPALGGQLIPGGFDVLLGQDDDDIVIGGSLDDMLDGGTGRDLAFGDNVRLDRTGTRLGDYTNPRFRALAGEEIYATGLNGLGELLIDGTNEYGDPAWGAAPPFWGDFVITVHDGMTTWPGVDLSQSPLDRTYGNDFIAGGTEDDMIFGQRGEDTIQGDGSLFFDVWDAGRLFADGDPTPTASAAIDPAGLYNAPLALWALLDTSRTLSWNGGTPVDTPRSFETVDDGDDYIEGGIDNDVIFGNLGQNDIIGGSSNQFGLTQTWQRDPSGQNMIFGGAGTRIGHSDPGFNDAANLAGDGQVELSETESHARNASVILGDNGNIFRLVGTNGLDSGTDLHFNFDRARHVDPNVALLIYARGVDLLDYQRWQLALDHGFAIPADLGFEEVIGASDLIRGESGDDRIYGMGGDNAIFGDGGDDAIVGGYGDNWISGGTGNDGIISDDGVVLTSRNNTTLPESLYGIAALANVNVEISTPGNHQHAVIDIDGELKHTAQLYFFNHGGNDIVYGGLGDDSLHSGWGNDAVSGAEALPEYYSGSLNWLLRIQQGTTAKLPAWYDAIAPVNPGDILQFDPTKGEFALYDEFDPWRRVMVDAQGEAVVAPNGDPIYEFFLNFDETEGPAITDATWGTANSDGNDRIFGDSGNDWLVEGTGNGHVYGGMGDDLINIDDNLSSTGGTSDPFANNVPDTHPSYEDITYGGAGRDILIGNTGGDRMMDWVGEFNSFIVPFAPFGAFAISRALAPQIGQYLLDLSRSDGADQWLPDWERFAEEFDADPTIDAPNPAWNYEPYGELGMIRQQDPGWGEQAGAPADPQPGNIPGGPRDVLRSADFNDGSTDGFLVDSGTFEVQNGALDVAAESLGGDAVSVYHVGQPIPAYFEISAFVKTEKATGGWNANAYVIFDYQSPTDFKFAGINDSTNKIQMGHRGANGWVVDVQTNIQVKADQYYHMLVAVNGTTVTVVIDNQDVFSHVYQPRVEDGWAYGLNWGYVGVGSDNARGTFENVEVRVLPPDFTLVNTEEFDTNAGLLTGPSSGSWQVVGGRYDAVPGAGTGTSLVDLGLSLNTSSLLDLSGTLRSQAVGGFIFDRYGPDEFKFAALDAASDQIIIGHHTQRRGWVIDAVQGADIDAGVDYELSVVLKGTTVSLSLTRPGDPAPFALLGHVFNSSIVDGDFGLLARGGATSFDTMTFGTNDSAFAS